MVERIGRRPLLLTGMIGCAFCWVGVTAATSTYANSGNHDGAAAQATIAFIFIFGAVYSFNITPLQALYPVEVLSFEMRAKGMAFSNLAVNAGACVNNLGWPVALKHITWHTYIIFCIWCSFQAVVWYFLLPETKGRTVCATQWLLVFRFADILIARGTRSCVRSTQSCQVFDAST